jgi:hypothetical protein
MTAAAEELTDRYSLAQWAATVFVVLVPIHVLSIDIGFELKPWFIPLLIGLVAAAVPVIKAAFGLARPMQIGIVLIGIGGVLGILNSANQSRALRHLFAVGIAVLVMLLVIAVKEIPYLGVAVRFGAIAMVSATVIEALLVMPRWVSVETLHKGTAFIGELAEIAYGDIILVTGTHGDSNFSALYAATWLFLVLAFPAERFFKRRSDGVIVGMLVLQLFLSLSKTGLLSVVVAITAIAITYRISKVWRNVRPALAAGLIAFVGVSGILLITDATDGHHDIAHGLRKRGGQVLLEADAAFALVTGDKVAPLDRAGIWKGYIEDFINNPLTGTGLGTPTVRPQYAHNAALEAAGGSGVFGLAGWFTVWTTVGLALRKLVREHAEALALVGVAGVVFMVSLFLSTNYEPIVALVFGIVLTPHLPRSVEPEAAL